MVFDNCNASSVAAFADVLCAANQLWSARHPDAAQLFSWQLASFDGRPVTTSTGFKLEAHARLTDTRAEIAYIPACHFTTEQRLLREIDAIAARARPWLLRHRRSGGWLAAGCSGAFVLGRAGLLDGRVATTSWWLSSLFRREFPKALLRGDEIVTVGDRISCAGPVNAHFNLALRVVETFGGRDLMLACAKVLLVDANRQSQRPYTMLQDQLRHTDEIVMRAQRWMQRNLHRDDFSIETLAEAVGASRRNLIRKFRAAHGITPIEYAQQLRVELAKNLLETTALDLPAILERIGYQDGASFRRLFRAKTQLSPREYRARFAIGRAARGKAQPHA